MSAAIAEAKARTAAKAVRIVSAAPTIEDAIRELELLEAAGLPKMRYHDLRHSCASLLLELGEHPKIVQEILGHSSIGITMDLYSHVSPQLQRRSMDRLDELIR